MIMLFSSKIILCPVVIELVDGNFLMEDIKSDIASGLLFFNSLNIEENEKTLLSGIYLFVFYNNAIVSFSNGNADAVT